MYIPKHFEERDVTVLHALIRSHPLGAWVSQVGAGLVVKDSGKNNLNICELSAILRV